MVISQKPAIAMSLTANLIKAMEKNFCYKNLTLHCTFKARIEGCFFCFLNYLPLLKKFLKQHYGWYLNTSEVSKLKSFKVLIIPHCKNITLRKINNIWSKNKWSLSKNAKLVAMGIFELTDICVKILILH